MSQKMDQNNSKRIKYTLNLNEHFEQYCRCGEIELVKVLLTNKNVDPSDCQNRAIRNASRNGHLEVVKLLLADKRVDPSDSYNQAIRFASMMDHYDVVKLLLADKRVNPSSCYNESIRMAYVNGHVDVVNLLLKDKRVRNNMDHTHIIKYTNQIMKIRRNEAEEMIPYYCDGFYKTYRLPDDIMHVILGECCFGYTSKECMALQNLIV